MSTDSLVCPFCNKKVGLAGMFVAHIIKCAKTELARKDELLREAERAIRGLLIMMDSVEPRKLDDALTWRENDELARSNAQAFIATPEVVKVREGK